MPTIVELKSQLKELKKSHSEIRITGLSKAQLQALVDKYTAPAPAPVVDERKALRKAERKAERKALRKAERKEKVKKGKSIIKSAVSKGVVKETILKYIQRRRGSKTDTIKKIGKMFFDAISPDFPATYQFKKNKGVMEATEYLIKKQIAGGMLIVLVALFNTDLSGVYDNGIESHFVHPSIVKVFDILGIKDYKTTINVFGTPDTIKYFDLTTTVDVKKTKKSYTRVRPTEGDGEYGGKVDIQFAPIRYKKQDYEEYLRLILVSPLDDSDVGFPFQTHFRTEYGRADDMKIDKYLEDLMKDALQEFYRYIRVASSYFENINKPLWKEIDGRISSYLTDYHLRDVKASHYDSDVDDSDSDSD